MTPIKRFTSTLALSALALLPALPASAQLDVGLVAYWPFDGDLLDASGTGAHGTADLGTSATPELFYDACRFGDGVYLNNFLEGSQENQFIEILDVPENTFDFAGGSMTVSFWVKESYFLAAGRAFIGKGTGNSWRMEWSGVDEFDATPSMLGGLATAATGDGTNVDQVLDNMIHHIVGVVEAGVGIRLYYDGQLIATADGDPQIADSDLPLTIGALPGTPATFSEGIIDDLGIWSRALTPAEIVLLWNGGTGVPISEALDPTDTDTDGMPDFYEDTNGLDKNNAADADQGADDGLFDNDGLTNFEEFQLGTNPQVADSDSDGLKDGEEVNATLNPFDTNPADGSPDPTDPLNSDSDGDGLSDGLEVKGTRNIAFGRAPTDPNDADSDDDGASDKEETDFRFNPNDAASTPPPFQLGLRGYWPFEEDLKDASGQRRDGVLLEAGQPAPVGNAQYLATGGKAGFGACILNDGRSPNNTGQGQIGPGQSIQVKRSNDALDFPGGSTTISAWVRLYSIASPEPPSIAAKGTGNNWDLGVNLNNQVTYSGGANAIGGGGSIAGPFWRHVVAVSEAGVATRLYYDGLLVAVGDAPTLTSNGLPMQIGGNPEALEKTFYGLMDEVAVWGRALDDAEVRQIWNDGQGALVSDLIDGVDTDGDGMTDVYESAHGLNPNLDDAGLDADGDSLGNLAEHDAGSDPGDPDTDGDGLNDGAEATAGTNPLTPDTDGDGLTDGEEVSGSRNPFLDGSLRDPFDPSTDPAGDPTDPLNSDSDGDDWFDPEEIVCKTDPNNSADFCPFPVPVAYWDFDAPFNATAPQVAVTKTTSGNPDLLNLTLRNNAAQTSDAGGRSGEPGDFGLDLAGINDGSNAKTAPGTHFDGISASSTYTVTFWQFNRQQANSSAFWVHAPASDGTQRGIQAHTPWGNGTLYFDQSGCCDPPERLTVNGQTTLNRWQHFAFVRNPVTDQRLIYVDGVMVASANAGDVLDPLNGILTVGSEGPNNANSFNGIIDEFAIFQVALAPEDIAALADGRINPLGETPGGDPVDVRITALEFNDASLEVTVGGMDPATSYILRRSTDGQIFSEVGTPFTGAATHVFSDPSPPSGRALYQVWTSV